MRHWSAIASLSTALVLGFDLPSSAQPAPPDVRGHWAEQCIQQMVNQKVISTFPDGTFRPYLPMDRGQFADVLQRAFPEMPLVRVFDGDEFIDLPQGYWALLDIEYTYETNFLSGYPNRTFEPLKPIPRLEVIVAIASGLNALGTAFASEAILPQALLDAEAVNPYARPMVAAAIAQGLVVSFPNRGVLRPEDPASRGEIAAFLCQANGSEGLVSPEYLVRPGGTFEPSPSFNPILPLPFF